MPDIMKIAERLAEAVAGGIRRIGQVAILPDCAGAAYALCHIDDEGGDLPLLESHAGPAAAREISMWAAEGHYRFTKGELSLKRGWLLHLSSSEELRQALDHFYPAAVGLWLAWRDGRLGVEHLRDKLDRQTGMYRSTRHLSDAGAQRLVREVYGSGNRCAKRILWRIDAETPLEESGASRFDGVVGEIDRGAAIPLLCREACNHLVAEARKASKAEKEAREAG